VSRATSDSLKKPVTFTMADVVEGRTWWCANDDCPNFRQVLPPSEKQLSCGACNHVCAKGVPPKLVNPVWRDSGESLRILEAHASRCKKKHGDALALAKCAFKKAIWVSAGDKGPEWQYALLAWCPSSGAKEGEHALTITVWADLEAARKQLKLLDNDACGGKCQNDHELLQLIPGFTRQSDRPVIDALVDEIQHHEHMSWVEIMRTLGQLGVEPKGSESLMLDEHNIVLWAGLSMRAVEILGSSYFRDQTQLDPTTEFVYYFDGMSLDLPLVKSKPPKGGFKKRHWAPVVVRPKKDRQLKSTKRSSALGARV
jgi:hypothetical protein